MTEERDLTTRSRARDHGLRRLRTVTVLLACGMTLLATALAALAAATAPGRKLIRSLAPPQTTPAVSRRARSPAVPPPPPLVGVAGQSAGVPAASAQPPTAPPAPVTPVAVSGGS